MMDSYYCEWNFQRMSYKHFYVLTRLFFNFSQIYYVYYSRLIFFLQFDHCTVGALKQSILFISIISEDMPEIISHPFGQGIGRVWRKEV